MHIIIWITLILYSKNPFIQDMPGFGSLIFVLLVLYSNYLFVTVGENPGYCQPVDDLELQEFQSKRNCQVCQSTIPNRAKHCKVCKKCVAKYDHHCFWIGGCVGELNHRSFWLFLLVQSQVILMLLVYLSGGMSSYDYYEKDNKRYGKEYGAFMVLFVIMFLFLLFSGGMLVFHSYLIVVGVTTHEMFKKNQWVRRNQSIWFNVKSTFCHGGQLQQWNS